MQREQVHDVVGKIDGDAIVGELLELAAIGGKKLEPTADHPIHFATNRLALTNQDDIARGTFVAPLMRDLGMDVLDDHPLALIGTHRGTNPDLAPVVIMSHIDTVPNGDIYDGTLGVLGGLEVVKALRSQGVRTERDITVVSLSGEESSRFGIALFGSRSLFQGLNAAELDSRKDGDQSIREALGEKGVEFASQPVFGPNGIDLPTPYAVVELHVEQDAKLIDGEIDLGIVDRIAAPARYRSTIGERLLRPDHTSYAHERYFQLSVQGSADHSGATPMGGENRADGLLETARILGPLLDERGGRQVLGISQVEVAEGAMNKIPGLTTTMFRLAADSKQEVQESYRWLKANLEKHEAMHNNERSRFNAYPFDLAEIGKADAGVFFEPEEMAGRQKAAFLFIESVNKAAFEYAPDNVVGTVATFATSAEGTITLEVDIRGIELESRNRAVEWIRKDLKAAPALAEVTLGKVLAGSGESPVTLDPVLVSEALDTIEEFDIGTAKSMFSAAGHDTQNAARAGIPAVMLFCQSKDGIAHNPEAYTSPENIQKGVRALAALTLKLASETHAA